LRWEGVVVSNSRRMELAFLRDGIAVSELPLLARGERAWRVSGQENELVGLS
jgi:hypothetical protein